MNKNTDKSLILRGSKIISIEVSMNIIKSTDAGIKATYIYGYTNSKVTICYDPYSANSTTYHYFIHVVNI